MFFNNREGDLQRHGARSTYIYIRRGKNEKALTGLSLMLMDYGEEPPLGFDMISRTPGSRDANLTYGSSRESGMFLCVYRGNGAPITDIGVVHVKKETIPPGFNHINRTPSGRPPNLDGGETILSYKIDYKYVMRKFVKYEKSGNKSDKLIAQCFACLIGGVYSHNREAFLYSLEAFTSLDSIKKLPDGILTDFINLVKDAVAVYLSHFNVEVCVKVLKWLGHVYTTRSKLLDTEAFTSILHLCMLLRHEDSREQIGKFILQTVIKQSNKVKLGCFVD